MAAEEESPAPIGTSEVSTHCMPVRARSSFMRDHATPAGYSAHSESGSPAASILLSRSVRLKRLRLGGRRWRGGEPGVLVDSSGEHPAVVVIHVFAEQVDASGRAGDQVRRVTVFLFEGSQEIGRNSHDAAPPSGGKGSMSRPKRTAAASRDVISRVRTTTAVGPNLSPR